GGGEARRGGGGGSLRGAAGVVDEHVEPTELLPRSGHDPVDLVDLPHVGLDEHRLPSAAAERLLGLVSTAHDNVCASVEEPRRDAAADPPAATRHDDDLTGHVERIAHRPVPRSYQS